MTQSAVIASRPQACVAIRRLDCFGASRLAMTPALSALAMTSFSEMASAHV
jgi:hypothetical protein